jgi:hypothetical protein
LNENEIPKGVRQAELQAHPADLFAREAPIQGEWKYRFGLSFNEVSMSIIAGHRGSFSPGSTSPGRIFSAASIAM